MDSVDIILDDIEDQDSSMELDLNSESDIVIESDLSIELEIEEDKNGCVPLSNQVSPSFEMTGLDKNNLHLGNQSSTEKDQISMIDQLRDYGEIYRIYNTITKRNYIGQTKSIIKKNGKDVIGGYLVRFKKHINNALKGSTDCPKLYEAIRLYGEDKFEISCCERCHLKDLNKMEKRYIYKYRARTHGYNSARGGKPRPGKIKFYNRMKNKMTHN